MKSKLSAGFSYQVEVIDKNGHVRDSEVVHNIMPGEGLNYVLGAALKGAAQIAAFHVGLYEGNYTPVAGDTAATFPVSATESIAYAELTRVALTLGTVIGGSADNSAARAEFTANATKTFYGGFISSSNAKGSVSGVLVSAVRFSSPKQLVAGEVLRVTAGFVLLSV